MVTLNRDQEALFTAHEHLVNECVSRLRRTHPTLDQIDPESVGRMALYEAIRQSDKARISFRWFAWNCIRNRLLDELRKHSHRERLCARQEIRLELVETKCPTDHSKLYDAIDKLPPELRAVVGFHFGLLGKCRPQSSEHVSEALAKLKELLD